MSDYHDFVQLGAEGQVAPTNYTVPGVLTTASLPLVAAQVSTQSNPQPGIINLTEQTLAVAGPTYQSPGQHNIGNPAGGGP
jgi:hypothetical protein